MGDALAGSSYPSQAAPSSPSTSTSPRRRRANRRRSPGDRTDPRCRRDRPATRRIPAELAPRLDDRRIREALKPAHVVAAFAKEVVRERRPRLGSAASGLPPEEALAWYLGNRQNLDPETRRRALERGEALIQEELDRE